MTAAYSLWISFFAGVLTMIVDLSSVFMTNAEMWHLAHDSARRLAVGDMSATEVEHYVYQRLDADLRDVATIDAQASDPVVVEISLPTSAALNFAWFGGLSDSDLGARVEMRDEVAALEALNGASEDAEQIETTSSGDETDG